MADKPATYSHADPHTPQVGHEVSWKVLAGTAAALIFLTWLTVFVASFDLGHLNLWVALIIAAIKASLVCLFFMHLKYDRSFNGFAWCTCLVFVAIFIGLTLTDTVAYKPEQYLPTDDAYAPARTRAMQSFEEPQPPAQQQPE